jgi:hypothetical protein
MPLSKYNRQFGGKPGSAEKAFERMTSPPSEGGYGKKKGKSVFYALKNKRKKMGGM